MQIRTSIIVFFLILSIHCAVHAQRQRGRGMNFDPSANLVIGFGGGFTKYFGEFTDQHWDGAMDFRLKYFAAPELAMGFNAGFGNLIYNRRAKGKFQDSYFMQFNRDPIFAGANSSDDALMFKEKLRYASFTQAEFRLYMNMLPRTRFNPYVSFGVGVFHFTNSDVDKRRAVVLLDRQQYTLLDPGDATPLGLFTSDLPENMNTLMTIPVSIGGDIRINQYIAVYFDFSYRFLIGKGKDYLDAFGKEVLENFAQHLSHFEVSADESSDAFGTVVFGVEFFLPLEQQKQGRRR